MQVTNRKNIRFWIYHNGGPIKIALVDGDTYTVHSGGPTEEGYDWMDTSYTRDGDTIYRSWYRSSCDCDGRIENGAEEKCHVSLLMENEPSVLAVGKMELDVWKDVRWPLWSRDEDGEVWYRDHSAEAAGY